jgi:precorrin-6B methylase 2
MEELLHALPAVLAPGGWVVANAICLESAYQLLTHFRHAPWAACEIVQLAVSRGVPIGSLTRFEPLSPVWIIAAQLEGN